ncbi:MAG: RNA polymerase factor sigma-54 [Tannerellaceae bacterium]|jgi:RNA polymerase sigma-54 factor|nr:RNA polymerase factor sigma-54 [Tannerellaceae bacterium]
MLTQKLGQKLQQRLSPQQILTSRLMELPAVELGERIREELQNNPSLEEGVEAQENAQADEYAENPEDTLQSDNEEQDFSLDDYMQEDDIPGYRLQELSDRTERREPPVSSGQSLGEYLRQQLHLRDLQEDDLRIGEYIIGSLDSDGYLRRGVQEIADDMTLQTGQEISSDEVYRILGVVQDLDPAGIAAADLRTCLLLQLKKKERTPSVSIAITLLTRFFNDLSNKRFDRIAQALGLDDRDIFQAAVREITSLNPRPGNAWDNNFMDAAGVVIPDFVVETHNGELTLTLNRRDIPSLHISREFAELLKDFSGKTAGGDPKSLEAARFIKQKLDSARSFISALEQRHVTLQRTMEVILLLQRDFFLTGRPSDIRPMILRDVAERAGLDISTISRVSNSKYVQTAHGIYPLKHFFSDSLRTDNGEEVSTRAVKTLLRELIDGEDKRSPLADDKLVTLLKTKGYLIARRTVAKYREQLGLPTARLRKAL